MQVFANQVNGLRHKGRKDEIFSGSFVFEGSCGLYSMEGAFKDNLSLKSTNLKFIFGRCFVFGGPCYKYIMEGFFRSHLISESGNFKFADGRGSISPTQSCLTAKRDALWTAVNIYHRSRNKGVVPWTLINKGCC